MMLTGSSTSPFAAIESAIYKTLFTGFSPYAALTSDVRKAAIENRTTNGVAAAAKESGENGATGQFSPACPAKGESGSPKAKGESENSETKKCKKTN